MLGIDTNRSLVGIIGRVSIKKGQLFLIQSLNELRTKGVDFDVLIFGSATINADEDKAYAERIQNFVRENGLEQRVFFVESQPDVAKFYNAIDIFVLASQSETYGMVTIEAMLSGLPILATNSGGTTEILGEGKYGTLYEYNNLDDFNKKLSNLLENPKLADEMAKTARIQAFETYNVESEVEGFLEIFKSLEAK